MIDRPYETDPAPLAHALRCELRFDAELVAAIGSRDAFARRGIDLSHAPRADDESVWDGSTTPAALCKLLRDYEAAWGTTFELVPTLERDRDTVVGPVARLLAPHTDAGWHLGPARSAYLAGAWRSCLEELDRTRDALAGNAHAAILRTHALLRLGDLEGARLAADEALPLAEREHDNHLHVQYLRALIATRTGQAAPVVAIGDAMLGALGGGRGTATWSTACDDLALDLAYLTLRACGGLVGSGTPVDGPTVYERVRALLVRHPVVALRLAADRELKPVREDILRAIQTHHEMLLRDIHTTVSRWRREQARTDAYGNEAEPTSFEDETALAESRSVLGLLDAMDARLRLRAALPDVLSSTQRSFSSEADEAERSSSAMTPLSPAYDPTRRDVRLREQMARVHAEAVESGAYAAVVPEPTPAVVRRPTPWWSWLALLSVCGIVGLIGADQWTHAVPPVWRDRAILALCGLTLVAGSKSRREVAT